MISKMIILMIRRKLGVKQLEKFRFDNQVEEGCFYYFKGNNIIKQYKNGSSQGAKVSINWLLDDKCKIVKV